MKRKEKHNINIGLINIARVASINKVVRSNDVGDISYVKYPIRNMLPYALNFIINKIKQYLCTIWAYFIFDWWKINLGKNVIFTGLPLLQKHPTAKITIGDSCIFRSAQWSNSIGINRRCFISANRNANIKIGSHCGFSGTVIAASESIIIGDRVLCGGNCTIMDTDRHPVYAVNRANNEMADTAPIVIENDVFLSINVVILKGCTIGQGTVVAANSVVASTLPPFVIAGGVPARVIRELNQ